MDDHCFVVRRKLSMQRIYHGENKLLRHLDIELTERCNNSCQHCYINLPEKDATAKSREVETQGWKDILQQAAQLGALSVRFTGGEPLLRDDFEELYIYTRQLGIMVILFTNARLITPRMADLFSRIPPLKKIEISVYGVSPTSYDTVTCQPGAFDEFQQGINLLLERQIPFVVRSVLLPQNRNEIDLYESWIKTIPWMDRPPSYSMFLDLRTRRDSPSKNSLIKRLRLSPDEGLALLSRHEKAYRTEMVKFCSKFVGTPGEKLFNCDAGESGCVDSYGSYQLCMMLRHPDTIFDLSKGTLREALHDFFPHFRELKATNPEYLNRCANCFLKGLCEQCPAKSWSEHGTLDTPVEYFCQVAHAQARYLGLIKEGERAWEILDWQARIDSLVRESTASEIPEDKNHTAPPSDTI